MHAIFIKAFLSILPSALSLSLLPLFAISFLLDSNFVDISSPRGVRLRFFSIIQIVPFEFTTIIEIFQNRIYTSLSKLRQFTYSHIAKFLSPPSFVIPPLSENLTSPQYHIAGKFLAFPHIRLVTINLSARGWIEPRLTPYERSKRERERERNRGGRRRRRVYRW